MFIFLIKFRTLESEEYTEENHKKEFVRSKMKQTMKMILFNHRKDRGGYHL